MSAPLKTLTTDEVAKVSTITSHIKLHPQPPFPSHTLTVSQHNKAGDLWVIIDSIVYDLSKFANLHPGGSVVLEDADVGEYLHQVHTPRRWLW
jgi:cytochrome b involved in lipid metabolism